jgi:FAD/FMN-containing dehydrogenase
LSNRAGRRRGLREDLKALLGPGNCITEKDVIAGYCTDWTRRYCGPATAVVRPASADQVAGVLALAAEHGAAVIPQGGNTGLVGGSVPRSAPPEGRPQVVLSLQAMTGLEEIDSAGRRLVAGAGMTLSAAAGAAGRVGLHPGIDLAARDSATLGGMVSTNAGGLSVCRYGAMRDRLAGLEAVLPDGSVIRRLSGLAKDSVGWEPSSLFAGSEGTLAIITKVVVALEPVSPERLTALFCFATLQGAIEFGHRARRELSFLESLELTTKDGMELVSRELGLPSPPGTRDGGVAWITLELAGRGELMRELAPLVEASGVIASGFGEDARTRSALWAYRERQPEAVSRRGVAHKLDVAVPAHLVLSFLEELPRRLEGFSPLEVYLWGHLAEANMHVNLIGPEREDERADEAVLDLVLELGGSISAEHGVGVAKARYLTRAREPGNLALMATVKRALDPERLLNPGVLEAP